MHLTSLIEYLSGSKQYVQVQRNSVTSVALTWFSVFAAGNIPAAGTLAIGNTANGVVPTDATAGYPVIAAFSGSNSGSITGLEWGNTNGVHMILYDRLFAAGAYSFNSVVTLASQPSYVNRTPSGSGYHNTELWVETVTAFTGNLTLKVDYLNENGASGSTGIVVTGVAPTVARCFQLPLQSGHDGVSQINAVSSSTATIGTFNLMVLRRLWQNRANSSATEGKEGILSMGCPQIFDNSALYSLVKSDNTSTGTLSYIMEITQCSNT